MTTFPTINMNGSHPQALLDQLTRALDAVDDLKWALVNAAPHGRDYPQGREAWLDANSAHRRRLALIIEVKDELTVLATNLVEQRNDWERK